MCIGGARTLHVRVTEHCAPLSHCASIPTSTISTFWNDVHIAKVARSSSGIQPLWNTVEVLVPIPVGGRCGVGGRHAPVYGEPHRRHLCIIKAVKEIMHHVGDGESDQHVTRHKVPGIIEQLVLPYCHGTHLPLHHQMGYSGSVLFFALDMPAHALCGCRTRTSLVRLM